jgi:hypothetical protein
VNHKILFKKQRALQKEREASTLKSFPCPQNNNNKKKKKEKKKNKQAERKKKTTEVKQNTGKCFTDKIAT